MGCLEACRQNTCRLQESTLYHSPVYPAKETLVQDGLCAAAGALPPPPPPHSHATLRHESVEGWVGHRLALVAQHHRSVCPATETLVQDGLCAAAGSCYHHRLPTVMPFCGMRVLRDGQDTRALWQWTRAPPALCEPWPRMASAPLLAAAATTASLRSHASFSAKACCRTGRGRLDGCGRFQGAVLVNCAPPTTCLSVHLSV